MREFSRQRRQQLRFRRKAEKEWEWGTKSMVVPLGTTGVQGGPRVNSPSGGEMSCELWTEAEMNQSPTMAKIILYDDVNIAKQPQLPQPLPISLVLQTLPQLHCPSLDTLQHLNVSLVVRGPKLNTVFEVQPHQCRVQGHDHFPTPAGHTIPDTSQDVIGFLGHLGTLLAHVQLAVNQHPQVLFCLAAFQPLFPKPVVLHGVVVAQVQDLALGLVEPHTTGPSPDVTDILTKVWKGVRGLVSCKLQKESVTKIKTGESLNLSIALLLPAAAGALPWVKRNQSGTRTPAACFAIPTAGHGLAKRGSMPPAAQHDIPFVTSHSSVVASPFFSQRGTAIKGNNCLHCIEIATQ
ncbi:hypothetical protein QYF61_008847 [Mycteria americana]|uniref:Uncharacterized protein n=1 Tax=Mycteria americana TaxID=33587 RepID=A0AAN7N4C9_MYCAM|nr:hypothetical protein QYF61_008847 [Mycteria americana]